MKRILIILAILLALGTIVFAVYFLFFRAVAPPIVGGPTDPFGGTGAGQATPGAGQIPEVGVPVQGAGEEIAPQLFRITEGPVAYGSIVFNIRIPQPAVGTSSPALPPIEDVEVRYIERASGNMYRFQLGARVLERLTNQTVPGIQEAAFATDGSRAFLRYSNESGLQAYALPADGSEGYLLQPGLSEVQVQGTSSVLTLFPGENGSVATRATLAGANPATAFTSLLSDIAVRFAGSDYAAYTKPSREHPGYAFSIDRTAGQFTRILGPLSGLAVLPSPSGANYLYSSLTGNTLQIAVIDRQTRDSVQLPLATLAEKCVWSADSATIYCAVPRALESGLPDLWYQGALTTSDRVWKVDLATRVASLVFDPYLIGDTDIDMTALATDAEGKTLVFTNKRDGSLWIYRF